MLTLFSYKTPPKFVEDFKDFYSTSNLKQIKILSMILLVITSSSRIITAIFYDEVVKIPSYTEHSIGNVIQLTGAAVFYALSRIALHNGNWSQRQKKALTLAFILFVLLITFGVSYVISMHNTKNTLLMFLIGIVTVSLFFAIEYREIMAISIFIVMVFILSMVMPKIAFQEKITNVIAAFILGFILLCFSRYGYYFKSQHFVRLKQLEEKNLEIELLNNQKGEILGFVAHDLRNPLNNIEALSQLMLLEDENNIEAKMIGNSANQAKEIINDLLEAVKSEQGFLETKRQELVSFLTPIIARWRTNSKREILFTAEPERIATAINSSKLERVIDNLISNALKFSPTNKPIEIALNLHHTNVCIVVKDNGIGIPADLQKHIFKQFSKAGRKGLLGEKSVGLGLHISKRIIERHKGRLLMQSKENEGTSFTILLPLS
ncbi:MAG: HAMP domain-containing histidine kinase [Pedobacter sp.]|nr:MAG: HAMP domain-containing histidine kinase [Pedobacter sp.]